MRGGPTNSSIETWVPYGGKPGLNHLGYAVDAIVGINARLVAARYRDSTAPNEHPHCRCVLFYDAEGNDWEFVEYATDDPKLRNDYELRDF